MQYKRIVSLVPSLTELVIDLGAEDRLIGRTKFCIHPSPFLDSVPIIGGTKNPNINQIISLKPDLVVANKEENRMEDIDLLKIHTEVLVTDIDSIPTSFIWIQKIGKLLDVTSKAELLISNIKSVLADTVTYQEVSCVYFIWREPWMSIGHDTYIHDVLKTFGLRNMLGHQTRYPTLSLDELRHLDPKLILLSSEPFPFKEKHVSELAEVCPKANIQLVDGEWFSWYGSRMLPSFNNLQNWRKFI